MADIANLYEKIVQFSQIVYLCGQSLYYHILRTTRFDAEIPPYYLSSLPLPKSINLDSTELIDSYSTANQSLFDYGKVNFHSYTQTESLHPLLQKNVTGVTPP